jgi:hypothetical protein
MTQTALTGELSPSYSGVHDHVAWPKGEDAPEGPREPIQLAYECPDLRVRSAEIYIPNSCAKPVVLQPHFPVDGRESLAVLVLKRWKEVSSGEREH